MEIENRNEDIGRNRDEKIKKMLVKDRFKESKKWKKPEDEVLQKKMDAYLFIFGWASILIVFLYSILSKITGFHVTKYEPQCAFHILTGYYCPGCGGTRSVILLLEGHLIRSFIYYPLVLYTVIVGGVFLIRQTITYVTKGRIKPMHMTIHYFIIALGIILINFIIKNICLFYGIDLLPLL